MARIVLTCRSANLSMEMRALSSARSLGEMRFLRSSAIGSRPCATAFFRTARAKYTEMERSRIGRSGLLGPGAQVDRLVFHGCNPVTAAAFGHYHRPVRLLGEPAEIDLADGPGDAEANRNGNALLIDD